MALPIPGSGIVTWWNPEAKVFETLQEKVTLFRKANEQRYLDLVRLQPEYKVALIHMAEVAQKYNAEFPIMFSGTLDEFFETKFDEINRGWPTVTY